MLLSADLFDANQDFILIRKNKQGEDEKYSTTYTLSDLEYDTNDVIEHIKTLTLKNYSETLVDKDDMNPPYLFVFGKDIKDNHIYIKLKIKTNEKKHVLCVSFHYAKWSMKFPYAG